MIDRDSDSYKLGVANAETRRLREVIGWIDCWVSNPAESYSAAALNGLFAMTRDKIAALPAGNEQDNLRIDAPQHS